MVAELTSSTLFLEPNQCYTGHCVLVFSDRHVTRIDELSESEWAILAKDLWRSEKALMQAFSPDHINIASIGQVVPHLHWHIVPRYRSDPRWGGPIWMTDSAEMQALHLSDAEYEDRATLIRAQLGNPLPDWPQDVDGDVLRGLARAHFDFEQITEIVFHVAVASWPPKPEIAELLKARYDNVEVVDPDPGASDDEGFVRFSIRDKLSYERVTGVQQEVTNALATFGGECDSWSVTLQEG